MYPEPLNMCISILSSEKLHTIAAAMRLSYEVFLKLLLNARIHDNGDLPRYRDIWDSRSFTVLLDSLKEYDQESSLKLIALITEDFSSFGKFLGETARVLGEQERLI